MTRAKKTSFTVIVLLFFAFCLFQPLAGFREDWPFSFFGMYMSRLEYADTSRFDIDVVYPSGEKTSIFAYGVNFYYLTDVLDHFFADVKDVQSAEAKEKLRQFLILDIIPVMKKHPELQKAQSLQIRYRFWKLFNPKEKDKADTDIVLLELPLSEVPQGGGQ